MSNTARRTAITYPNGRVVNLGYGASGSIEDAFSLVKTVAIEAESGDKVDYTRVGLGRFVTIAYPQPCVELSMIRPGGGSDGDSGDPYDGFDRFSRVQQMRWQGSSSGTPIDAWKWGYNEASNRTWKKNLVAAGGQDEAYAYDGLSQVIRDAVGTLNINRTAIGGIPGEEEAFTYDPTGNWLTYRKDEDGTSVLEQTRSNNRDNQLVQIGGSSQGIEYDRAGNAVKIRPGLGGDWSKHFTLVWDAWNRLVEVKVENGATVQKNTYDGLSRRIIKESDGTLTHTYWSDRWKPLEERVDSESTAARSYLWGERPGHRDELVLRDRDTNEDGTLDERLYATMDYFNGTSILDTSGNVLERYAYGAFGPRRVMAPDFTSRSGSLYDWDFGFQGQFRDGETGWYNYGFRFYVPLLGRWINRDPIGEDGGINLYGFVGNDGVNMADYLGMYTLEDAVAQLKHRGVPQQGRTQRGHKIYSDTQRFEEWIRLELADSAWLTQIPECPSEICIERNRRGRKQVKNCNNGEWGDLVEASQTFHPGAKWCMRSIDFGGSAQQCCYDEGGKLRSDLPAAGTPDRVVAGFNLGHYKHDVEPYNLAERLGRVSDYGRARPPSKGGGSCYID